MLPLLLAVTVPSTSPPPGTLVIVGGALDRRNDAVFEVMVGAMPVDAPGIVIIPAASGAPAAAAESFARDLQARGVAAARIVTAHVALMDDPTTSDVDESRWRDGGNDRREVAKLDHAGAIWFVGGDQARIAATLLRPDGGDTPLLAAIRSRLAHGAVIGGSSAGAAIMSRSMMLQGDSVGALWPSTASLGEPLKMGQGLGFLPHGLVDQHFDTRARLGRLAVALSGLPEGERIGFGIDENTALVVHLATGRAEAIGAGSVTIVDARAAQIRRGMRFAADGLLLSVAGGGDNIALASGIVAPAAYKRSTVGHEADDAPPIDGGGLALPDGSLTAVIGRGLLDNSRTTTIDRTSTSGRWGVTYRFTKGPGAKGWWGRDAGGVPRYTVSGVGFAIVPLDVTIHTPSE